MFDSLSEMRLLAQNSLRYRRQILALKQYFSTRNCTVLMLDDRSSDPGDLQLHSIAHGVITLEQAAQDYGSERRRLRVVKMRGVKYRGGFHDFVDRDRRGGGVSAADRRRASQHVHRRAASRPGSPRSIEMLGGGLAAGTNALFNGPSGRRQDQHRRALRAQRASSAARRRPISCSTRARRRCWRAPGRWAWICSPHLDSGALHGRPDRPGRAVPGRIRQLGADGGRGRRRQVHRHRQPQRVPAGDAGREISWCCRCTRC